MTTDRRGLNWPILVLMAGWLALCVWLFGCKALDATPFIPNTTPFTNYTQTAWSELRTVAGPGNYSCCQSNIETETWCRGTDETPTPGQYGTRFWMRTSSRSWTVHRWTPLWRGKVWRTLTDYEQTRDERQWWRLDGAKATLVEGVTVP